MNETDHSLTQRVARITDKFEVYRKLSESGSACQIICHEVSNLSEINQAIAMLIANGNRIHSLWLLAHGTPSGISLTSEHIDSRSITHLTDSLDTLEPEATIVLLSCFTGSPSIETPIAASFAEVATGRKVYAPKLPIDDLREVFIRASFYDIKVQFLTPSLSATDGDFTKTFRSSIVQE